MTPHIFFWKSDDSGCGYYRMHLPAKHLSKLGLATTVASTRLDVDRPYEIIVAQRVTGVKPSNVWRAICDSDTLAVMDMDDDLFNVPTHNPSHSYYADPLVRRQLADNLAASNLLTVSTPYLAERMKEYTDAPIEILPNCLDLGSVSKRPESGGVVSVGWAGSGTHKGDLEAVAGPVKRGVDLSGSRFITVGADYADIIDAKDSESRGWCFDLEEFYTLVDFNIGIAPIEDNEFNRSKSALKAIEYGARGIPVIASNVTPYTDYVADGIDGFLVRSEHEWTKYIRLLASDAELRESMADAAHRKAHRFDIRNRAQDWFETYTRHMAF
jgi:glycosyltransferase involved in cell wall biosynthesis